MFGRDPSGIPRYRHSLSQPHPNLVSYFLNCKSTFSFLGLRTELTAIDYRVDLSRSEFIPCAETDAETPQRTLGAGKFSMTSCVVENVFWFLVYSGSQVESSAYWACERISVVYQIGSTKMRSHHEVTPLGQ